MSAKSTGALLEMIAGRRALLKGGAALSAAATGAGLLAVSPAFAASPIPYIPHRSATASGAPAALGLPPDSIHEIFTVARTAEQLAVTFYSNGIANAGPLGLTAPELDDLKAAVIEEQIHQILFTAEGGASLTTTFSFPDGAATFTDLTKFLDAQQTLEGAFDSAFIAAVLEFAQALQPRLAQIACQIAMIESEHRVLGRNIARNHGIASLDSKVTGSAPTDPADNWAFAPVVIGSVGQAPSVLASFGYLSPKSGNSYTYQPVLNSDGSLNTYGQSLGLGTVYGNIMYKTPYMVPESPFNPFTSR